MLINGTFYNSECWQSTDVDKEIKTLNEPDQTLLCGLISGHSKVPLDFWFLEFSCVKPFSAISAILAISTPLHPFPVMSSHFLPYPATSIHS